MTILNLQPVQYIEFEIPQAHLTLQHSTSAPTLFPLSVDSTSALALILFHPFLRFFLSLNVFVANLKYRDEGHFGRQTADFSLTSNPSSARPPSASSFAAWTWQVGDLTITASTNLVFFFYFLNSCAVCLPAMRPISAHLFLLFCLCVSPSL